MIEGGIGNNRLIWSSVGLSNNHQTLESYGIKEDAYIKITFPAKRRYGKSKAATTNIKRRLKVKTKGGNPK